MDNSIIDLRTECWYLDILILVSGFERWGNLEQKIIFELHTAQNLTQWRILNKLWSSKNRQPEPKLWTFEVKKKRKKKLLVHNVIPFLKSYHDYHFFLFCFSCFIFTLPPHTSTPLTPPPSPHTLSPQGFRYPRPLSEIDPSELPPGDPEEDEDNWLKLYLYIMYVPVCVHV